MSCRLSTNQVTIGSVAPGTSSGLYLDNNPECVMKGVNRTFHGANWLAPKTTAPHIDRSEAGTARTEARPALAANDARSRVPRGAGRVPCRVRSATAEAPGSTCRPLRG